MSLESFSYRNHASRTDITVSVFFLFLLDSAFAEARIWFSEALYRQGSNEKLFKGNHGHCELQAVRREEFARFGVFLQKCERRKAER